MSARLEELRAQQAELARLIAEEMDAERERKRAEEANKPLVLTVERIDGDRVFVRHEYRDDLVDLARKLPSRYWNGTHDTFDLKYWPECLAKMLALPNTSVVYVNGVGEQLNGELAKPDYEVTSSPDDKFLLVKVGRADSTLIMRTPGAEWDGRLAQFKLPIVEGWRLYERLQNVQRVLWADHALKLVTEDTERRSKLDAIALRQESTLTVDLCGHELRTFQKVDVEFIDASGGRAIVANQMGLGKTWEAIAYARYRNLRTLVICPASLKANWTREIVALTGKVPAVHTGSTPSIWDMKSLAGSGKQQFHVINYDILSKKVETFDEKPSEHDPAVMLKTNIRDRWLWVDLINMSGFDLVVLDEAHYIKNTESLRSKAARLLNCPRVLCMTGTPVLNRPGELWPMLTLLQPDKFPSFDRFVSNYTYNNKDAKNVAELRELLKPLMIRRLKKDVVAELPAVNRVYRWTELSDKAVRLYNRVLQGIYESLAEWDPNGAGAEKAVMNILVQLMRLKQICAVDRIDFVADLAVEINDSIEERNGERDKSHKVLVFSQFVPIVHAIARRLGAEAVWMTGELNAQARDSVIQQFKLKPETRFLVATDKVAGEGLNLYEAHAVVFADLLWTPAAHEQCEGRAYGRLADLHGIDSYWCAATDTVDDDILKILARKMNVINQVVEGIDAERGSSIVKELLENMKNGMLKKAK